MNEDEIIETIGMFYSSIYDSSIDWYQKISHKFPESFDGDDAKLDFARILVHFTLCKVAGKFEYNEEQDVSPSVRYYVYHDGEEYKEVDDKISPVVGWLSDVNPGAVILGKYAQTALPSTSFFELSRATN